MGLVLFLAIYCYWCSSGKYWVSWEEMAMLPGPKRDQMEHGGGGMIGDRVPYWTGVWKLYLGVGGDSS